MESFPCYDGKISTIQIKPSEVLTNYPCTQQNYVSDALACCTLITEQ